jgi:hypothetical protein
MDIFGFGSAILPTISVITLKNMLVFFFLRFLCFETILTTTVVRFGRTKRLALCAPVFLDYQAKLGFAGSPPIVENIKRDPMARCELINVLNWKGIKETMKQNF